MKTIHKWIIFLAVLLLGANGISYTVLADHDDHQGRHRHQKRERNHDEHYGKGDLAAVTNPAYTETCGACHFPYQPGLLPSGSWERILAGLGDHFGEALELDPESGGAILEYLRKNAADCSPGKLSLNIMRCLGGETPSRITLVPYIQRRHREIPPDVFKRESVGSMSNCSACHRTAENGNYDEDGVAIPR